MFPFFFSTFFYRNKFHFHAVSTRNFRADFRSRVRIFFHAIHGLSLFHSFDTQIQYSYIISINTGIDRFCTKPIKYHLHVWPNRDFLLLDTRKLNCLKSAVLYYIVSVFWFWRRKYRLRLHGLNTHLNASLGPLQLASVWFMISGNTFEKWASCRCTLCFFCVFFFLLLFRCYCMIRCNVF